MKRREIDQYTKQIINLYDKNYTMLQIANKFNSNKRSISRILKKNGMKIKRYKRIYSKFYNQTLSKRQIEILVGSMLGDGCISQHHIGINSCRYIETHSIDQIEYSLWKYNEFDNFISSSYRIINNFKTKSYGTKETIIFNTILNKEFVKFKNMFYEKNKKKVPQNISSILSPLGLAVWYMDDGSLDKTTKRARISTYAFLNKDVNLLTNCLKNNFNLNANIIESKKGNIISFNKIETLKLFYIVKDHIHKSMSYKIKLINNPVETEDADPKAFGLKYPRVNTSGSRFVCEMMV